jgi:hypothetical protein
VSRRESRILLMAIEAESRHPPSGKQSL